MDTFELNKIIGAILGTLLFVMGVGFLAEGIYAPITSGGPTYNLPEPAANAATTGAPAAPQVPLPVLLSKADPQQGADSVKKCQSCHDFTEGGPNKTGPDLYNIVGSKIADVPGYSFSDAVQKLAAAQHTWTYENLDKWLTSPAADAPGTKMTFVGIDDPVERANVLAYLRTLSKSPVPFPPVAAAAPAAVPAAAAPAAGTAPAAAAPRRQLLRQQLLRLRRLPPRLLHRPPLRQLLPRRLLRPPHRPQLRLLPQRLRQPRPLLPQQHLLLLRRLRTRRPPNSRWRIPVDQEPCPTRRGSFIWRTRWRRCCCI